MATGNYIRVPTGNTERNPNELRQLVDLARRVEGLLDSVVDKQLPDERIPTGLQRCAKQNTHWKQCKTQRTLLICWRACKPN